MLRPFIVLVLFLALGLTAACGSSAKSVSPEFVELAQYCDGEISYQVAKRTSGDVTTHEVKIRVGKITDASVPATCDRLPLKQREVNFDKLVSSYEEGEKIVQEYKQMVAKRPAEQQKKLEDVRKFLANPNGYTPEAALAKIESMIK